METNLNIEEIAIDLNHYLDNIVTGCHTLANKLREGNIEEGLLEIRNFSEGMEWISLAIKYLEANSLIINFEITQIQEFLGEINEGLELKDFNLVADLFEYEIAPFFKSIDKIYV